MKIHEIEQGTPEWLAVRSGIVTASELDSIITPLWKPRTGDTPETYLCQKLAERWLGMPKEAWKPTFAGSMEQGKIREDEAIPFLAFTLNLEIEQVGFITTDDGKFGCSPDGMIGSGESMIGCEVKCPEPQTHCKYLLANELPKDYAAQVHGSMAVTGAKEWYFLSYCRNLPPLILKIKRDEEICGKILAAVSAFDGALEAAYAKVVKANGGEPKKIGTDVPAKGTNV